MEPREQALTRGGARTGSLWGLGWVFLRIGTVAFGGLGAALALVERELVAKRAWLTAADLTEALTYTKLLPGSTVVQVVSGVGHMRLCWVTLRELISFKVFFLQYTTESSFCGRKYATRACGAERTRDVSRVDVPRGMGYPGTSGVHHPCARRSAMRLRPEPLPPIPDTTAAAVRAAFPKGNL